ncbi:MAG: hypothetical protein PHH98_02800 [Candidatus Gracilibacteria bacterium]|nr:hypothetical protein [Candidatus Gracilibacteria bacterium]
MENLEKPELSPEELAQKKALIKKIVFITILIDILIAYFAFYFFVFKKEDPLESQINQQLNYQVVEKLGTSCEIDDDCETPMDYLIRSNCLYTSKCLEKQCSVVCPATR